MTATEIIARFRPTMPKGIRFAASHPIAPWKDEDGNWHPPGDSEALIRVANSYRCVDAVIQESDLTWTDEMFHERIIRPMLACLEHTA